MGIVIGRFPNFGHAASPVSAILEVSDNMADLTQVHFLPVWEKHQGKEQVCFKLSVRPRIVRLELLRDCSCEDSRNICGVHN